MSVRTSSHLTDPTPGSFRRGLLELPCDVQSIIWIQLSLKDINRLRQTCCSLATEISINKQLWVYIFNQEVRSKCLRIPSNLQDIDIVEACDIESWVKHAILLDRRYKTRDNKLSVRKFDIRHGLHVTWLKLIFDRWCLVAAADDEESELSLWELVSNGTVHLSSKVYLDAPVMDGKIDCSSGAVRCAITIGSVRPYILILGIHHLGNNIILRELARIPNASHTQYLKGNIVGFAVRNGNDAYPYLTNWTTGDAFCLRVPSNTTPPGSCPFPIEACKAIMIKNGFVFTLHRSSIQVFREQTLIGNPSPILPNRVASIPLATPVVHGEFLEGVFSGPDPEEGTMIIRIIFQSDLSELHQASLTFNFGSREPINYNIHEFSVEQPPGLLSGRTLHLFHMGSSARTFFGVMSLSQRHWWSPTLLFASLRPITTALNPFQVDIDYIPVSSTGLPLVRLLSAVDFDDANGLLLLGTTTGDVRLASVLPRSVVTPDSMKTDLSLADGFCSSPARISDVPIPLDLPVFYSIRKKYRVYEPLPQDAIRLLVSQWEDSRLGVVSFSDWTNDWAKSEYLWDWILPLSRWGPLDNDFTDLTPSTFVRNRLQALGEIIPVIYCIHNHCEVVFRIGDSMFYCRMMGEDGHDVDVFEGHDEGLLGVLPISYDQFLNDPTSILPSLWSHEMQSNLDSRTSPASLTRRGISSRSYYTVRDYLKSIGKEDIGVTDMETWSNDDWDKYTCAALNIRISPHAVLPE